MIKFIHTADIHFGMENYGRIDPATGIHTRLLDFHKALSFCIDTALQEQVDFFLFCGDAYKTAHPSPTQQKLLMESFLRLQEAHIPIVIIVGNHDHPLSFGRAHSLDLFGQIPLKGFHVISKPRIINLETKNGTVQIVGIPWPTRTNVATNTIHAHKSSEQITDYISQAVANIIKDYAMQLNPTIPSVLAGHLTVSSGIFSGSEKRAIYGTDPVLLPSQLAIKPFDYVALGHLHRHQNLNPNGYPAIIYSGSIERIDFGERKEDKGFCIVSIEEKNKTYYRFVKTPIRPFIQMEIHLQANSDQTKQIIKHIEQYAIESAVIKIIYHVPADQPDTVDIKALLQACSSAMYVAAIVPVRPIITRARRTGLQTTTTFEQLLASYFNNKPEFTEQKQSIIDRAQELYELAQQQQDTINETLEDI